MFKISQTFICLIVLWRITLKAEIISNQELCDINQPQIDQIFNYSDISLFGSVYNKSVFYSAFRFNNYKLKNIPKYLFANFCFFEIDLSDNEIEFISGESLANIGYINQLYLSNNRIKSINGIIDGLNCNIIMTALK